MRGWGELVFRWSLPVKPEIGARLGRDEMGEGRYLQGYG